MDLSTLPQGDENARTSDVLQGEIVGENLPEPPRVTPGAKVFNCGGCCGPLLVGTVVLFILLFKGLFDLLDWAVGGVPEWFQQLLALVFIVPVFLILFGMLRARLRSYRNH